jgi:hypothetical protein
MLLCEVSHIPLRRIVRKLNGVLADKRQYLLAEFLEDFSWKNARFGISHVHPNRAFKKCKIRSLMVEYFISDFAVSVITPKACLACERSDMCTDDFLWQVMIKLNLSPKDPRLF